MAATGNTNVGSKWSSGNLVFENNDGDTLATLASTGLTQLGLGVSATAVVATSDGLTTGTIADGVGFAQVTSASANNIVVLPTPTPGTIVMLHVGANGFELRSSAPATVAINGGSGADAESAIPANTVVFMICTTATTWQGWDLAGTTFAAVEAAA